MDQQSTAEPTARCWLKTWAERLSFWPSRSERLVAAQTAQSTGQLEFSASLQRERSLCNGISPWLAPLATVVTQDIALRAYFIAERRQATGGHGDEHGDWVEAERQLRAEAAKK